MHKNMPTLICYWQQWLCWSQISTNRRIFAAAITVGVFTLLVSLATVVKDIATAHQFGTSDALDSFIMAYLLPSFAVNVIAGSFNSAVIPTYIQVREGQGNLAAQKLFSSVMIWSIALLLVVSVVLALSMHYIMPMLASGFSAQKLESTQSLFLVLLPVIVISGIATIWSSILNAGERFVVGALAPVMVPVAALASLLLFGNKWGIFSLAVGTVVGYLLQCILLAVALKKHHIRLYPQWHGMTPELKRVITQYSPMVAGAFLMSSTGLVDQIMAAMLVPGSVAALSYGNKIVSFAVGLGAMAIGTAVLPHFSQMAANGDLSGIRHTLKIYTRLILIATVPLTVILFFMSENIITFLFERGAFVEKDTHLVAQAQSFYVLQIPFYILSIMFVRLLSAFAENSVLMKICMVNFIVNILGNYILMKLFGVAGIALSTSIVYLSSFILIFISLSKKLKLRIDYNGNTV